MTKPKLELLILEINYSLKKIIRQLSILSKFYENNSKDIQTKVQVDDVLIENVKNIDEIKKPDTIYSFK